jgi:hypothetical protein
LGKLFGCWSMRKKIFIGVGSMRKNKKKKNIKSPTPPTPTTPYTPPYIILWELNNTSPAEYFGAVVPCT